MLQQWWQQYAKPAGLFQPKPDFPPVVDTYLMSTLARRLNLRLPQEKQTKSAYAELRHELGLNVGTESLRMAMMQDRILGLNNLDQPADQPLPEPLPPPEVAQPPSAVQDQPGQPGAAVPQFEPMAMRVPAECFYARFGSYANFLWMQDTLAKWGGDVQNLISLRGLDRGLSSRMEKQLVAEADGALADARPYGHCRRGHHRHRHVLPRRGLLRHPLPRPQQLRPVGQLGPAEARTD